MRRTIDCDSEHRELAGAWPKIGIYNYLTPPLPGSPFFSLFPQLTMAFQLNSLKEIHARKLSFHVQPTHKPEAVQKILQYLPIPASVQHGLSPCALMLKRNPLTTIFDNAVVITPVNAAQFELLSTAETLTKFGYEGGGK